MRINNCLCRAGNMKLRIDNLMNQITMFRRKVREINPTLDLTMLSRILFKNLKMIVSNFQEFLWISLKPKMFDDLLC